MCRTSFGTFFLLFFVRLLRRHRGVNAAFRSFLQPHILGWVKLSEVLFSYLSIRKELDLILDPAQNAPCWIHHTVRGALSWTFPPKSLSADIWIVTETQTVDGQLQDRQPYFVHTSSDACLNTLKPQKKKQTFSVIFQSLCFRYHPFPWGKVRHVSALSWRLRCLHQSPSLCSLRGGKNGIVAHWDCNSKIIDSRNRL